MMRNIWLLTDYKGYFGSKQKTKIYRSGMNIERIIFLFQQYSYRIKTVNISQISYPKLVSDNPIIIYTSAEDKNNQYKNYIEDIIYDLENRGLKVLPDFSFLRAHNNKVAMELLRMRSDFLPIKTIKSKVFGTHDELINNVESFSYPVVIKAASGAMSRGVLKADNSIELVKKAKLISSSKDFKHDSKEYLRLLKYGNNYKKESFYRKKFIVQNFIPGLENDWKILIYGQKCFVLHRKNRKNDFRASGSGNFEFRQELPEGMLDFALSIRNHFKVPHISLDVGFDGTTFHLIEFQFLNFGTTTLEKSPFYFERQPNRWTLRHDKVELEKIYVESIHKHINEIFL